VKAGKKGFRRVKTPTVDAWFFRWVFAPSKKPRRCGPDNLSSTIHRLSHQGNHLRDFYCGRELFAEGLTKVVGFDVKKGKKVFGQKEKWVVAELKQPTAALIRAACHKANLGLTYAQEKQTESTHVLVVGCKD